MDGRRIDPRYVIRHGTIGDKEAVLRLNVLVTGGSHDYLPSRFDSYIRSWNTFPIVCEFEGKLVGFMFYSLIDGGQTVVSRAGRIDVSHQGRGITDRMIMFYLEQLYQKHLLVKTEAFTTTVENESHLVKKHAHELFCRTLRYFSTSSSAPDILRCFQQNKLPYPDFSKLVQLSKPDIRSLLLSPVIYEVLFHGDKVMINSVPYKCTPDNVWDIMNTEDMTVFSEASFSGDKCASVSFGCVIYVLSGNNLRFDLTVYAKDKEMALAHLLAQTYSAAVVHKNCNIRFSIAVQAPVHKNDIGRILQEFGIEEYTYHNYCDAQKIGVVRSVKDLVDKYAKIKNVNLPSLL